MFMTTCKLAASGDSNHKALLFNYNEPPGSNQMLLWKKTLTKKKHPIKKGCDEKVKCFQENDKSQVWGDIKLLVWFAKNQNCVEIK